MVFYLESRKENVEGPPVRIVAEELAFFKGKIVKVACMPGCLEIGVNWFLFSIRDLGAVLGFTSPLHLLAVSTLLELA